MTRTASHLSQVNASVRAAQHLTDMDKAAIALARRLAKLIDEAEELGFEVSLKASFGPVPTLNKVLDGLGLTPNGRKNLGEKEVVSGKLAGLRKGRGGVTAIA